MSNAKKKQIIQLVVLKLAANVVTPGFKVVLQSMSKWCYQNQKVV